MNYLIINNINHSNFNLEWAKRGGVICPNLNDPDFASQLGKLISVNNDDLQVLVPDNFNRFLNTKKEFVRMATPAECEAVGVEYIEPPTESVFILCSRERAQRYVTYQEVHILGVFRFKPSFEQIKSCLSRYGDKYFCKDGYQRLIKDELIYSNALDPGYYLCLKEEFFIERLC